ncbi:TPA: hypothetical protein DEX28_01530 [Patescibacteria group bacterium]|nr:MAG: hypothetical protein UW85_C0002G0006 [Parcubacteria group bacterium GW2011_GWA1_Parcubacteria_45_10]KKT88194.1 MAG: hypothetical protein UW89_C0010G0005 [Parcubacteria group bacterium GW2011_GWB1_45_10]HCI05403.1 hypothetical protein [Patescibacteria group bacterium]
MTEQKPNWFKAFLKKLVPDEEFGALEIGEKNLRYLLFSKYDLKPRIFSEIKLEPGIIVKGELKNKASLVKALDEMKKIARCDDSTKNCSPVIVTLSSANFFFNVLELPEVPEASYDEAVRLNAVQATPMNLDEAYFDWQNLGVNLKTLQREFLIGVGSRVKIDAYLESFDQAGFQPLALESRSLSLLRNFNYFSETIEKNITLLMVEIGDDGISFLVGKQGKLFFDFYLFWDEIPEALDQKITREDLEAILLREVKRIIEYFSLHSQEQILHFCLFAPVLKNELVDFLAQKFNLRQVELKLPDISQGKAPDVYAGLIGAGIRGSLIPRDIDDIISLLPQGTEKIYQDRQTLSFVSLWTKVVIAGLFGVLLILGSTLLIVQGQKSRILDQINSLKVLPETSEALSLQKEAVEFNQDVEKISRLESIYNNWSVFMVSIVQVSQAQNVSIIRLSLLENSQEIRMKARAPTQKRALDFQKQALETGVFSKIEIPLSSFSETPEGVEFDAIFSLLKK